MLKVIDPINHRATMDIDLLGRISSDEENILQVFQSIASAKCTYDAIEYENKSMKIRKAQVGGAYSGYALSFHAHLFKSRIPMHIDVGFNDIIIPSPQRVGYPTMLDMPEVQMEGYSFESIVAEKLEAMTKHGLLNTRMKDFYDVWTIFKTYHLDNSDLFSAVKRVFENRDTDRKAPASFSYNYQNDQTVITRWKAFLLTIGKEDIDLKEVINQIENHLGFVFKAERSE